MKKWRPVLLCIVLLLSMQPESSAQSRIVKDFEPVCDSLSTLLSERTGVKGELKLKNIMKRNGRLDFYFTVSLSDFPWRESDSRWFRSTLGSLFPEEYSRYRLGEIYSKRERISTLTVKPLGFSGSSIESRYRTSDPKGRINPLVTSPDRDVYGRGLSGRHIAVWPSHGRYFDQKSGKWRWQRPVLFTSVEDLLSTGIVLPYVVPMLENAGACVMLPRERDVCPVEIVIDNDPSGSVRGRGTYSESGSWAAYGTGFADTAEVYTGLDNPFKAGTSRTAECIPSSASRTSRAVWTPDIPERGEYAVYVSYRTLPNSTSSALYYVHHLGGTSRFIVNQQIGGGTWIYLGTFEFDKGTDGSVELLNSTPEGRKYVRNTAVSADAVKIGGGMGNIARNVKDDSGSVPETSGLPRYAEAARYWLQWAGMDSTVFSQHNQEDDYRDDLFSRGDWVSLMSGGSYVNPGKPGRGIPFDLTFAVHSDAGVTPSDSTIGTLSIYTRTNEWSVKLPDGEDRLTSREFADIVQSQTVHDIRESIDPEWSRRQIWDRAYRESRTPPCPTVLLENFSHQNFADMRYALDPSFRFVLARSIYKGILKYLSNRYGCPYTVQPLPVRSFSVIFKDGNTLDLSWLPREDSTEPTAVPEGYRLYTRLDDGGFDNGVKAKIRNGDDGRVHTSVQITPGHIYSFKVTAVNAGGESFPSETLSAGIPDNLCPLDSTILIVNNFTRVSAPAWFDTPEIAGFAPSYDPGMPYIKDISYTGDMYEFRRTKEWTSDAAPGFGASSGEHSGHPVPGNTFDYAYVHGKAVAAAGYPFCSASSEAFAGESDLIDIYCRSDSLSPLRFIAADIICGEQVTTLAGKPGSREKYRIFPVEIQRAVRSFTGNGGHILVSGSHIGTDIWDSIFPVKTDSTFRKTSIAFAEDVLGFTFVTGHASGTNKVRFTGERTCKEINRSDDGGTYKVVSPDGIAPSDRNGYVISEYADTEIPSGICHNDPDGYRTVCFGFPVEALKSEEDIYTIISQALEFLIQ